MVKAMANRWSASSSLWIALWKNKKIRIDDLTSELLTQAAFVDKEEDDKGKSTLFTEFGNTTTPPDVAISLSNFLKKILSLKIELLDKTIVVANNNCFSLSFMLN